MVLRGSAGQFRDRFHRASAVPRLKNAMHEQRVQFGLGADMNELPALQFRLHGCQRNGRKTLAELEHFLDRDERIGVVTNSEETPSRHPHAWSTAHHTFHRSPLIFRNTYEGAITIVRP